MIALFSLFAHVNIDVEIDVADAGLRSPVRAALVPVAIARAGVGDIGELQASPLRQRSAALTAKLPGEDGFLTHLVGAEDVGAELAIAPLVDAGYLLLGEDCLAEERVGAAGHRGHMQTFPDDPADEAE